LARIYLDEEVSARLRDLLREAGHDVTDAKELGHRRGTMWTDARQLFHAARERRVLVSSNRRDFEILHDAWRRWPAPGRNPQAHAGIIVYDQRAAQQDDRLGLLALQIGMTAQVEYLMENEFWANRGGHWYWFRWSEEGFQPILIT
jgi:hypothetical protein